MAPPYPHQHGAVRFAPGEFRHNVRAAAALVPALAVVALLGGRPVAAVLTVGAMVWYLLDAMGLREGSLTAGWATVLLANVALAFELLATGHARAPLMTILLLLSSGGVLLLAAMWLTLQFRWVQMQHPAIALAFERQVIVASHPLAGALAALGAGALVDAGDVAYYLAAALCALYAWLARPLASSFHSARGGGGPRGVGGGRSSAAPREAVVQSRGDAALMALVTAALPAATYAAVHGAAAFDHWVHIWSLLLLGAGPVAFIAALPDGLWWLPGSPTVVKGARRLLLLVAALGLLAGFEGRVVFHAFAPYIKLQPPWSYVAVTGALLGAALLAVAHITGLLGTALDVTLAGSCLLLCTTAGAVAGGVPVEWLPAPLVAAVGLALYYDSRSVREYAIFVAGGLLTAAWFISHHFWFLDARVGHLRVRTACALAAAALLPALLVPGLVVARAARGLVGVLLFVQAELVAVLEEQLYSAAALEGPGAESMYPAYLVLVTSAAGAAAALRLADARLAPRWAGVAVPALYAAKLAMLPAPEAHVVLPVGLLALAAAAPLAMHPPPPGKRRPRLAPWQGLLHAAGVTVAAALARFAVFDLVQWAVAGRPHEATLLGALLIVWAVALAPLVSRCYSHNQTASRLTAGVLLIGAALALLQPPLPRAGGASCPQLPFALCPRLWDARHVPMHEADDAAVWGSGLGRREHWPRWLLVAAAGAAVVGVAGGAPGARSPLGRLALGATAGGLAGWYLALEAAPGQELLQTFVLGTTIAVVAFVTLLQNPLLGSPAWLPLVGAGWLVAAGFALTLQSALPLPDSERFRRLYPDSAIGVEAERRAAGHALLVAVFAAHAALLAFALKLRVGAAARAADAPGGAGGAAAAAAARAGGGVGGAYGARAVAGGGGGYGYGGGCSAAASVDYFCGAVPASVLSSLGARANLPGAGGIALKRLQRDGLGWAPTAGNLAALLAFAGGLALNAYLTGGEPEGVFLLAPLLLLLSQDPLLLRGLDESRRYVPPALAATLVLAATGALQVAAWAAALRDAGFAVANGCLLLLALPLHAACLHHAWHQKARPLAPLAVLAPMCLVSAVGTQLEAVRYLAGAGLAMGALMYFEVRQLRQRGMKMV